ncbi:hypothetical protein BOX15_Mlig021727g2 [Macrostomum lignano]|uniref:Dynamin-type G domain-containing protein n=1 Tax=Macrostomum lignano TaxID=282301 RepID=A0A267F999_9PLAT|nr:hypothetical protein BOX15_Mlig021727g2 [Macrostomum lignano]
MSSQSSSHHSSSSSKSSSSSNKRQHKSSDGPTPAKQVKSPDATETVSLNAAADASKPFTPALSQQYRERIRPVLNSIDRLRSHGLQNELRLPTVAVVGDQSVGKSSVLEAISGVDLPRGTGIVTRCPLQLSMRSKPTGDWTGRISYQNRKGEHVEREISKKCEVDEMVRKVQNEITGDSNGVSTEQIDLTIESADVSDLTLVDLPGIARYSEKNPKINEVTKQLILSYISQDQVIILVVVPCSVDIETVEAIALAKQVDPGGTRTIGVLTCPDLTNPGSEEDIKAIVNNQGRVRLHKGFVMVKCRSPKELRNNISLSEVAKIEEDYFKNDPHFSQLPKDIVGTKTLAEKLTNELFKAVAAGIETLEESLKSKLKDYEEELKDLEDSLCETDSDKRAYLMRKLQQFASKVHAATASPEDERDAFATGSSSSLYSSCLTNCSSFGYSVSRSQPAWIIDYSKKVPNGVSDEVQLRRGRELPTFTFVFPVVQKIVFEEYLPKIEYLAKWLLGEVQSQVTKSLENLTENCFKAFPRLLLLVKETVVKAIEAQEAECRADLAKLIAHERRLFTQDSQFSEKLRYVTEQQKELAKQPVPPPTLFSGFGAPAASQPIRISREPQASPTTRASQGGFKRAEPQVSRASSEPSHEEQIRLGTKAYLLLACQRISDTVPMSVLCHMLDGVATKLVAEITRLFAGGSHQVDILDLLREKEGRQRRRRYLIQAACQMRESRKELQSAKQNRMLLED